MADDPIIALRKLAKDSYDVALQMAVQHMAEAEKPNSELCTPEDLQPTLAAQGRRATHIQMAAVYASIAQAAQKVPGQQF